MKGFVYHHRIQYYYFEFKWATLLSFVIAILWSSTAISTGLPNPKERIDFWQKNYRSLDAGQSDRAANAQKIFERLRNAAGKRNGVHPRLFILAEDPLNISLPISIPDGWVILSKGVLDLCYRNAGQGDDRLAFVLAHEIAHLYDDDFWHMNFFNAIELSRQQGGLNESVLKELEGILGETDKVAAKELRADERGILLASMAGYNVSGIVANEVGENFFRQWEGLLDITQLNSLQVKDTQPTTQQRTAAVLSRLRQLATQSGFFQLGLIFYQAGDFKLAINAFDAFLRQYPAREVYHNLAASYHQLALVSRMRNSMREKSLPFKLPISIDPSTRAAMDVVRGAKDDQAAFQTNIELAIRYYKEAIELDPAYILSYINLGSAYVDSGEPFKAVAVLQDALRIDPQDTALLNVLGVAFYQTGNVERAIGLLQKASTLNAKYPDPLFNLGKIASNAKQDDKAKKYWTEYVASDEDSYWSHILIDDYGIAHSSNSRHGINQVQYENLLGVQIGNYNDEIPSNWGKPQSQVFSLLQTPHQTSRYKNGLTAVFEGDEIRMIVADQGFAGKSRRGIGIGNTRSQVVESYGRPDMTLAAAQGESLVYQQQGITFVVDEQRVLSWILY